ncbi:MAG: DUF1825 family protein [Pseudanabaenaceae cyanobacterium SKYGB_i_bin29]|nr:DUF1825 family protein [Pseudanabaenaceae cyanobacterium SKYG29]MDW8420332.1 DUF1825 family protein [Pseudanabaenaceae cyanobacterium SKYGB_i_bin29]
MTFFESEVVQDEARRLWQDYEALMTLGSNYGKFDREGKKIYIEKMEEMTDRFRIFLKRFELSDDFMAKMALKQLEVYLSRFGVTTQQMFDQMTKALEKMKEEIDK